MNVNDTIVITRIVARGAAWIVQCKVSKITEKAIQVQSGKMFAWFPKSALVNNKSEFFPNDVHSVTVARWFTISEYYERIEQTGGEFSYAH